MIGSRRMSLISDERAEELLANEKEKDAEIERLKRIGHQKNAECFTKGVEIAQLQAEIERLKLELHREKQYAADLITTFRCEVEDFRDLAKDQIKRLEEALQRQDNEIIELKAILVRAAEALEFWMKDLAATEQQYVDAAVRDERLLDELRKM
jgi:predicted RNase H-like nuclease (RuvC/YqgF family)